jgi:hypothetical protein
VRYLFFALFLFYAILCGGCFSFIPISNLLEEQEQGKRIHHIVLCWLKEPGNLDHQSKIIEATKTFRDIPGVLDAQAGTKVPSDRAIVDDSFDVGILIVVADEASLRSYLEHSIHQEAKNEILVPLVDKIVVYDFKN